MAVGHSTTFIGTNEWLQTVKRFRVAVYSDRMVNPRSQETLAKTPEEIQEVIERADETHVSSTQSSSDQSLGHLFAPHSIEWSDHATREQERILSRLFNSGHEEVARRLSSLIDILSEDDDDLAVESMEAVASFFIKHGPKYPGPIIVSDDDGLIGVQWRIPIDQLPAEGEDNKGGILYLKFISDRQVNLVGALRSQGGAEVDRYNDSTDLRQIMDKIRPFRERLDW